ncbi:MAG: type II toxin-antitoxin system HicB family antitoxin [Methanobacterium sp.]
MINTDLMLPIFINEEDDCYVATCPVFNIASQGKTIDKALEMVKKAVKLVLEDEDFQKQNADDIEMCKTGSCYIINAAIADKTS